MIRLLILLSLLNGFNIYSQDIFIKYNDAIVKLEVSKNGEYLALMDHKFSILIFKGENKLDSLSLRFVGGAPVDIKLSNNGKFIYVLVQVSNGLTSRKTDSKLLIYERSKSGYNYKSELILNQVCTHLDIIDNFILAYATGNTKLIDIKQNSIRNIEIKNLDRIFYLDRGKLFIGSHNSIYSYNLSNGDIKGIFDDGTYVTPIFINKKNVVYIEGNTVYKVPLNSKKKVKDSISINTNPYVYFVPLNFKKFVVVLCQNDFILDKSRRQLKVKFVNFSLDLETKIIGNKAYCIDGFNIVIHYIRS